MTGGARGLSYGPRPARMTNEPPAPSFQSLGLGPELCRATQDAGFSVPTPVQAAVIEAILAGRDVVARAATGSGKTAAFGLPLLQELLRKPRSRGERGNQVAALVLVPTRELAMQISQVLNDFSRDLGPLRLKICCVYGGVPINPQMMTLRGGADIVVATPGRLLDLHEQNAVKLEQLRCLVLDEADRLLKLGFRDELAALLALLPATHQSLLFSATMPEELDALMRERLRDPLTVDVTLDTREADAQEPDIEQHVYVVDHERKTPLLVKLLQQDTLRQALVFVSMKKTGNTLFEKLRRADIHAAVFHADKSQRERTRTLADFRNGTLRVLIATDLAARGIDIEDMPAVINFELPRSPNDYLHRIGRTGRAGKTGLAVSLIEASDEQHFRVIEKRLKRRLPREHMPGFEPRSV